MGERESMANIFSLVPDTAGKEFCEKLVAARHVRIERIVSKGDVSPADGWYDQEECEWVIVLDGAGRILFGDGEELLLRKGDYVTIPAHRKHKVVWTDPHTLTVWLAVFYK